MLLRETFRPFVWKFELSRIFLFSPLCRNNGRIIEPFAQVSGMRYSWVPEMEFSFVTHLTSQNPFGTARCFSSIRFLCRGPDRSLEFIVEFGFSPFILSPNHMGEVRPLFPYFSSKSSNLCHYPEGMKLSAVYVLPSLLAFPANGLISIRPPAVNVSSLKVPKQAPSPPYAPEPIFPSRVETTCCSFFLTRAPDPPFSKPPPRRSLLPPSV